MKTTTSDGGSVIPKTIVATMEADWRSSLKASPYRSIATTDGGTMWSAPSITSTSTTTTGAEVFGDTRSKTYTASSAWMTFEPMPAKRVRLTKAQRAMVTEAILEQIVNPPPLGWTYVPHGTTGTFIGTGTVTDVSWTSAGIFKVKYDET